MNKVALFITHKALPGKRDEVRRVWQKHLQPAIAGNPAHEAYFYCFDDDDPDTICVFQQYADRKSAQKFLKAACYAAYLDEVSPLLAGQPQVRSATAVWANGAVV